MAQLKLGEQLVESGAVSAQVVQDALQQQARGDRRRLGELLMAAGALQPRQLATALGAQHGLPVTRLEQVSEKAAALVPLDFQVESRLVLFGVESEGGVERLQVAVEDPAQLEVVDELGFQMQRAFRVYLACREDLDAAHALLRGERPMAVGEPELIDDDDASVPVVGGELVTGEPSPTEPPTLELPSEWAESVSEAAALPAPMLAVAAGGGGGIPAPSPVLRSGASSATPDRDTRDPTVVPMPGPTPLPARPVAPAQAVAPPRPVTLAPRPVTPVPLPTAAAAVRAAPVSLAPGEPARPPEVPGAADRPGLEFSEEDLRVLDAIDRLAAGADEAVEVEKVRPARMVASLVRLLMRKGVIQELEFLEELSRK